MNERLSNGQLAFQTPEGAYSYINQSIHHSVAEIMEDILLFTYLHRINSDFLIKNYVYNLNLYQQQIYIILRQEFQQFWLNE